MIRINGCTETTTASQASIVSLFPCFPSCSCQCLPAVASHKDRLVLLFVQSRTQKLCGAGRGVVLLGITAIQIVLNYEYLRGGGYKKDGEKPVMPSLLALWAG